MNLLLFRLLGSSLSLLFFIPTYTCVYAGVDCKPHERLPHTVNYPIIYLSLFPLAHAVTYTLARQLDKLFIQNVKNAMGNFSDAPFVSTIIRIYTMLKGGFYSKDIRIVTIKKISTNELLLGNKMTPQCISLYFYKNAFSPKNFPLFTFFLRISVSLCVCASDLIRTIATTIFFYQLQ